MIELMTSEQTRTILREELEIVDLERLVELRPIVGAKSKND